MSKDKWASALVAALLIFGLALGASAGEVHRIILKAKKFEWNPPRIEVKVGEPVELVLKSEDRKHGFHCEGLGLGKVTFSKDKPTTLTFTPESPGTYPFRCSRFCGMGHRRMKGEIVVVP